MSIGERENSAETRFSVVLFDSTNANVAYKSQADRKPPFFLIPYRSTLSNRHNRQSDVLEGGKWPITGYEGRGQGWLRGDEEFDRGHALAIAGRGLAFDYFIDTALMAAPFEIGPKPGVDNAIDRSLA